jgi:hypothetical protein
MSMHEHKQHQNKERRGRGRGTLTDETVSCRRYSIASLDLDLGLFF